jgi:hypothetical protein
MSSRFRKGRKQVGETSLAFESLYFESGGGQAHATLTFPLFCAIYIATMVVVKKRSGIQTFFL